MHLGGCKLVYVVSNFFGPLPTSGVLNLDPKLSQEVVGRLHKRGELATEVRSKFKPKVSSPEPLGCLGSRV